jgi:very-short-patch-repair endonuclease
MIQTPEPLSYYIKSDRSAGRLLSPLAGRGVCAKRSTGFGFRDILMRGSRPYETNRSRTLRKNQTSAEKRLWEKLRGRKLNGYKFVRQEPVGPYFADFLCRERALVVEVDGATHSTEEEIAHDQRRDRFLEAEGLRIVRVTNEAVFNEIDGVCETILAAIEGRLTV